MKVGQKVDWSVMMMADSKVVLKVDLLGELWADK
jgi:hypothetical protein